VKKRELRKVTYRERAIVAGGGLFFILWGYAEVLRGRHIYTNGRGTVISSEFELIVGALLFLASAFPWDWLGAKLMAREKKRFP
jgi:hypothetical protein